MSLLKTIMKPALLVLLLVGMSACSGHYKGNNTYVARSGSVTTLHNDKESCTGSCNADYDRCGDTSAAHTSSSRGLNSVVGAKADCTSSFRTCLKMCKVR